MAEKIKYVALVCTRNEEDDILDCVLSILKQTIPPICFVVIDDGSIDDTTEILTNIKQNHYLQQNTAMQYPSQLMESIGNTHFIIKRREDRGFSALGSYLMADVYNTGFAVLNKIPDWEYVFIGSSANRYPPEYVELLSQKIKGYGVISGQATDGNLVRSHPAGGGRLIRKDVMEALGGYYPRRYDWEGTTERMALYMGLKSGNFPEIQYIRTRLQDRKHKRNHIGWGFAMKEVGYLPVFAIARAIRVILAERRYGQALTMLVGYFAYRAGKLPPYNVQVRNLQRQRVAAFTRKLLHKMKVY